MIRTEGLYKSFDNKVVLSDINVTFEAGKVNLIIGNGFTEIINWFAYDRPGAYLLWRPGFNPNEFQADEKIEGRNRSRFSGRCSF